MAVIFTSCTDIGMRKGISSSVNYRIIRRGRVKRFFYWFCGIIALFALMVVIGTAMETEASMCADDGRVWDEGQ